MDRCTTVNITTSDIFRPKSYNNFKELYQKPQSENYEIVSVKGSFPILYDSIQSAYYLKNGKGLTKYDSNGRMVISNDLANEKFPSTIDFSNFIPYVFAKHGVYDFSGDKIIYSKFSKVLNFENELNNDDFKSLFENYYKEADLVAYDNDRNFDYRKEQTPMYFKFKDNWVLLFSQKGDFRFSHQNNGEIEADTIGQIDHVNFSAKLSGKRLILLRDDQNKVYSSEQISNIINDEYLNMYFTQILKERKLTYKTGNNVKMISRKKEEYYFTGSYFSLPDWVSPSFINKGYFRLSYNNEDINFKGKAVKYFNNFRCENNLFLYEIPQKFRRKSQVAFLDYNVNIGGYRDDITDETIPFIKNTGLFLIRKRENN
ncbi:MAG: hypothetical protein J6O88_14835 [Chryseobacterium sp.]|uniref:hypothetical protein n=1 Tax=Chryseobacterium sp. TaxID=1871047 RepID=UPI001B1A6949|nr:hypothetical protein [Chryseobacterium sp.]MBO6185934.1 hypothetical protein [Chryseobacterium sp.]